MIFQDYIWWQVTPHHSENHWPYQSVCNSGAVLLIKSWKIDYQTWSSTRGDLICSTVIDSSYSVLLSQNFPSGPGLYVPDQVFIENTTISWSRTTTNWSSRFDCLNESSTNSFRAICSGLSWPKYILLLRQFQKNRLETGKQLNRLTFWPTRLDRCLTYINQLVGKMCLSLSLFSYRLKFSVCDRFWDCLDRG